MSVVPNSAPPSVIADAGFAEQLGAARRGEGDMIGVLLERYRDYLLTIARQELPQELRVKLGSSDLVQGAVLKGYGQFGAFDGETPEQLAAWLRQILLNHIRNVAKAYHTEKRDVKREQVIDHNHCAIGGQTPSRFLMSRERDELLQTVLARLPELLRRVIELRHREDLSFADIAKEIGKSEDTARRTWAAAIRQLQEQLQTYEHPA
jgi:RNA polymerase sigma-70 factor (ECF subfamily)